MFSLMLRLIGISIYFEGSFEWICLYEATSTTVDDIVVAHQPKNKTRLISCTCFNRIAIYWKRRRRKKARNKPLVDYIQFPFIWKWTTCNHSPQQLHYFSKDLTPMILKSSVIFSFLFWCCKNATRFCHPHFKHVNKFDVFACWYSVFSNMVTFLNFINRSKTHTHKRYFCSGWTAKSERQRQTHLSYLWTEKKKEKMMNDCHKSIMHLSQ